MLAKFKSFFSKNINPPTHIPITDSQMVSDDFLKTHLLALRVSLISDYELPNDISDSDL